MAKTAIKKKVGAPGDADGPNGVTKKAKKTDGGPKRAMSAYLFWLTENRSRIAASVGSEKGGAVFKAAGQEWKALEDKSKWEKMAVADKKRFEGEKAP